jgi:hypothetical protein
MLMNTILEAPGVETECAGQVTDMELETGGRQRNRSGIAGRAERRTGTNYGFDPNYGNFTRGKFA